MGLVNEVALKEALTACRSDQEFVRGQIPWQEVEDRAREEIAQLVETDLKNIADDAHPPNLKNGWSSYVVDTSPRLLTLATARLIQQYCRIRQERVRDSNPDAPSAPCTNDSA